MSTINLREEYNLDESPRQSINGLLDHATQSKSVEIVLPSGEYRLDNRFLANAHEDITIRGAPHATLVVDDPDWNGPVLGIGWDGEPPGHLTLKNITIDQRADGVGQRPLALFAKWGLTIENVRVQGKRSKSDDNINTVNLGVTRENGQGYVKNLRLPHGGEYMGRDELMSEYIGVNVEPNQHKGTLTLQDCYVQGFANNAYYMYRNGTGGTVRLLDCVARNCGLTYFRLDKGDVAEGCKAYIHTDPKPYGDARALWPQGGGVFRDIEIYRQSGDNKLIGDGEGSTTNVFQNIYVENSGDGDILDFKNPGGKVIVDGLEVHDTNDDPGDAKDYYTSRIRRKNVTLRNVEYHTSHDQRRGIFVGESDRVKVEESSFDVNGAVALEFKDCGDAIALDDWNEYGGADVRQ